MNKKLLVLAVAGAFAASGAAFANDHGNKAGAKVNGYVFTTFALTDEAADDTTLDLDGNPANANERKFKTSGKLSFSAMPTDDIYTKIDVVINNSYAADDYALQQAFGAWRINDMAKLKIGQFNSPLGAEAHNKPDLTTISHGLIRTHVLNDQMDLGDGNNVQGAAVHLNAGPAKVTVGLLNDIGEAAEENSFLLSVGGSVLDGLDLNLGVITQENDATEFGNLINFNAAYSMVAADMPIKLWLDYITASENLDSGLSLGGHIGLPNNFGVTLRYDMLEDDAGNELTAMTLAGIWQATDAMDLRIEWRNDDDDVEDFNSITLAAAFKF